MKMRSVKFLTLEGLKNVWNNRLMSLASIGVLMACMLIMGVAVAFSLNVDSAMDTLQKNNVVMVYFQDELDDDACRAAAEQIGELDNVLESLYIPKEEGLRSQIEKMGEEYEPLFSWFEGDNPLPNAAQVKFEDLSKFDGTIAAIKGIAGVDKVNEQRELAEKITAIRATVTVAGVWIIALLLIIALVIISNTVRITMYSRKREIQIEKAVGATDGFIRFPFLVEGVLLGLISAVVTTGLLYAVYRLALTMIENTLGVAAIPFREFVWPLFGLFAAIGVVVGLVGSFFIIRKYLRKEGSEFNALL